MNALNISTASSAPCRAVLVSVSATASIGSVDLCCNDKAAAGRIRMAGIHKCHSSCKIINYSGINPPASGTESVFQYFIPFTQPYQSERRHHIKPLCIGIFVNQARRSSCIGSHQTNLSCTWHHSIRNKPARRNNARHAD